MAVPYTFGTATASIPLSQLDSNFSTAITLGNTAIQLGNTVTTLNNMTLANVTISSGNLTLTNVSATTANVTTANVVTLIVTGNETVLGNTTVTGTATAAKLIPTGTSVTGNGMYLPATNSVGISTAGTNAVYIDASQNVGIGTSSPAALKLTVEGNGSQIRIRNSTTRYRSDYAVNSAGTASLATYDDTGAVFKEMNVYASPLTFNTTSAGAETVRIDSSGNVGIGTSSPSATLSVNSTVSVAFLTKSSGTTSATFAALVRDSADTNLLYVRSDGYLNTGTSTSSPYNYSATGRAMIADSFGGIGYLTSIRSAKTNIQNLTDVSWLYNLNPVTFNYRKKDETNSYTDEFQADKYYGLIAEEVETVNKELCFYDEDETLRGVSYDKLTTVLLKAIQEQQALITSLTARITALETA